jgi:phosphoacetylglucosamine mutase
LEYDIGVYFEANGHGTVIFSDKAQQLIRSTESAVKLQQLIDVINQTVGDAISDMLLVECILAARGWSVEDWMAQYTDLPNKLMKASVRDRTLITTKDAERQVVTPEGLQDKINSAVAKYNKGRSFVRPSGTEDVVRVYAEADTRQAADDLANDVVNIVKEMLA